MTPRDYPSVIQIRADEGSRAHFRIASEPLLSQNPTLGPGLEKD